jgi:hypothetical protein
MPIRTSSLHRQIHKNGVQLHRAIEQRLASDGAERPASEREQELLEERRKLKEAQAQRHEEAAHPKPKAARVVREPRPVKEAKPKAPKAPKAEKAKDARQGDSKDKGAKASKDHKSRAEKAAQKAEALAAARRTSRPAAKPGKH